jgi:hypothetical protein
MSDYAYTFDYYDFLHGETVTIRLTKAPYTGVVVSYVGNIEVGDEPNEAGEDSLTFDYEIVTLPDGFDVELLNSPDFTHLLGTIMLGWLEKHFEENGSSMGGVVNIHAAVDAPGGEELEPTSVEYDASTGATSIQFT